MLDSIIVRYSNILFSYSTSVRKTLQKTIRPNLRKSKNYFDALPKKARSRQWQLWDQEFLIKYVRFIPCFCKIIVSFDSDLISFWRIWIFAFVMLQIIYRRRRLTSHERSLISWCSQCRNISDPLLLEFTSFKSENEKPAKSV